MGLPNIKAYINAVLAPKITALANLYHDHVAYMQKRVTKQDHALLQTQEQLAKVMQTVLELQGQILKYQNEVITLRKVLYTSTQVKEMLRRIQELNYVVGNLYYKFITQDNVTGVDLTDMPSFNSPWIPGDYVLTEDEVEREWRMKNNISQNAILTENEKKQLQEYKDLYYRTHFVVPGTSADPNEMDINQAIDFIKDTQENIIHMFTQMLSQNNRVFKVEKESFTQKKINQEQHFAILGKVDKPKER